MGQHVYLLQAIADGRRIYKIGMTTRAVELRLQEINDSWDARCIRWSVVRILVVTDCEKKESELHHRYASHRFKMWEITEWLGGVCDGDSEIFSPTRLR
jgi:T5orf172 domain